jgi:Ca2+-binding RTX toxin-like protein
MGYAAASRREGAIVKKAVRVMAATALIFPLTTAGAAAENTSIPLNGIANLVLCDDDGNCPGTAAADVIVASNKPQYITGGPGDDHIELDLLFLQGSSDTADGGPGRDCIDGGGSNDLMLGGAGDDNVPCEFSAFVDPAAAMTGGPGDDTINGGPGNDSMNGIFDSDTLIGGDGDDLLQDFYPLDADKLFGGTGNDTLNAVDAGGDDVVDGGPGMDTCYGDAGDKFVNCEIVKRVPPGARTGLRIAPGGNVVRDFNPLDLTPNAAPNWRRSPSLQPTPPRKPALHMERATRR